VSICSHVGKTEEYCSACLDAAIARAERAEADAKVLKLLMSPEREELLAERDAALARVRELETLDRDDIQREIIGTLQGELEDARARIAELETQTRQLSIDWTDMDGRKLAAEERVRELEDAARVTHALLSPERVDLQARIAALEGEASLFAEMHVNCSIAHRDLRARSAELERDAEKQDAHLSRAFGRIAELERALRNLLKPVQDWDRPFEDEARAVLGDK